MAKLTNVRERVHQPFRDTLIRTSGMYAGNVQDSTDLFTMAGRGDGLTNQQNGSTLPSDQSMVVLALRVFLWFRRPYDRPSDNPMTSNHANGDFMNRSLFGATALSLQAGSVMAFAPDEYRLYWQASEQILWSFGTGQKFSISSMPSTYFPYGGGLHGTDPWIDKSPDESLTITWNNGMPSNQGILRLARAVLIPPRQNVMCNAQIERLPDGGNLATFGGSQGTRNMLSCRDNLNTVDLMSKVVSFTFDGLFSRDVQ